MKFTHVLYHANCPDGFGAAWAAWKVLADDCTYLPVRHGDPPPLMEPGSRVAILDFSYDRATLEELRQQLEELRVLDHHRSAHLELDGLDYATFDLDKSGARLAWEYFHPGQPLPELLSYVEDRDLWRWALPDSREISMAIQAYPLDFQVWDSFDIEKLRVEGQAIQRYQRQQLDRSLSRVHWKDIGGHTVPCVNSCLLQSEIGDELCKLFPEAAFAGVYYVNQKGVEAWSLRSIGEFDVAAVAKTFGGGGHRNAAGFARARSL